MRNNREKGTAVTGISQQTTIVEWMKQLTSGKNIEKCMNSLLEKMVRYFHAERAYVMEVVEHKDALRVVYSWESIGMPQLMQEKPLWELAKLPRYMRAYRSQGRVITETTQTIKLEYPDEYEMMEQLGIQYSIMVPCIMEDQVVGYFGIDNSDRALEWADMIETIAFTAFNEMQKRQMKLQLNYLCYYDALTGVANKQKYLMVMHEMNESEMDSLGVLAIDLDGLKQINQENGHTYGDSILKDAAIHLIKVFEKEWCFRLNGDEFMCFCPNTSREDFMEKLAYLEGYFDEKALYTVSMGHAWDDGFVEVKKLTENAREYMEIHKKDYYCKTDSAKAEEYQRRLQVLLEDLENHRYEMYLQPKVDIYTGEVIGAEALVRYHNEEFGLVPPAQFIGTLEKQQIIKHVDYFMLEEVYKLIKDWEVEGKEVYQVSVNFSRITMLDPGLNAKLKEITSKYQIPDGIIEIEITESVGNIERNKVIEIVNLLKSYGFDVSIDDFGAEYANMAMLTVMDFDVLKLDRTLVEKLVSNEKNQIILRRIIEICKDLGVRCIAEGVETIEQIKMLRSLGCDFAQGYYFGKPNSIGGFEKKYH